MLAVFNSKKSLKIKLFRSSNQKRLSKLYLYFETKNGLIVVFKMRRKNKGSKFFVCQNRMFLRYLYNVNVKKILGSQILKN